MSATPIHQMLLGAIACASLLVGLFFARFWWTTKDRFFLYFAISFSLEGLNRAYTGYLNLHPDNAPLNYIIRLVSYALILVAIWEKNRPAFNRE